MRAGEEVLRREVLRREVLRGGHIGRRREDVGSVSMVSE